jgi:hypothetical protein
MPIIAGTNLIDANIGYVRAIDAAKESSPEISLYDTKRDGIKKEKDKAIANNQTFLLIELIIGLIDRNKNAVIKGYDAT